MQREPYIHSWHTIHATCCRVDAVSVLGTKLGQLTGAPAVVPLSEQDALLSFLLALQVRWHPWESGSAPI